MLNANNLKSLLILCVEVSCCVLASFTRLFLGKEGLATDCSRMRKIIGYFPCKNSHKTYQKNILNEYTDKEYRFKIIIITGHYKDHNYNWSLYRAI